MTTQAPAPGWYADPNGQPQSRWWDGQQWTDHVHLDTPPPPQPTAAPQVAPPVAQAQPVAYGARADLDKADATPALFSARQIVVRQKAKIIELTNEYDVFDGDGQLIARVVEIGQSTAKKVVRFLGNYDQFFTHRLEVRDPNGVPLLNLTRPAKFAKSRMQIAYANGTPIGEIVQENIWGKKRFGFSVNGVVIGGIQAENWRSWDFAITDAANTEIGRINKQWAGVGRELFTTADHYQVLIHHELPYPLRLMVIASAVTVDTALKQDD